MGPPLGSLWRGIFCPKNGVCYFVNGMCRIVGQLTAAFPLTTQKLKKCGDNNLALLFAGDLEGTNLLHYALGASSQTGCSPEGNDTLP